MTLKYRTTPLLSKENRKIFFISVLFISPLIVVSVYFVGNWYSLFHSYSIGMVFGIFAYGYFLLALILSTRIKILDNWFGQDQIIIIHGYLASSGLVLAIGHYLFKSIFTFEITGQVLAGSGALIIFLMVGFLTQLLMKDNSIKRYFTKHAHKVRRNSIFDYSRLKLIHNSISFATAFAVIHVYLASSTQESVIKMAIMSISGASALFIYFYHKGIRLILLYRRRWTITQIIEVAPGIVEISMRGGRIKKHKAGQFAYFRILSSVCGYAEHPFTLSSAPGENGLAITVKNLGNYTEKLKNVQIGTTVLIDGPYGIFTPCLTSEPILLIAGGIGITPFLSILKSWRHHEFTAPIILIWSCRFKEEMFKKDFLEELAQNHSFFKFIPIVSTYKITKQKSRHINKELLTNILEPIPHKNTHTYICGPRPLMNAVISALKELNFHSTTIHYEKFSL